jgi:hypothetical protein
MTENADYVRAGTGLRSRRPAIVSKWKGTIAPRPDNNQGGGEFRVEVRLAPMLAQVSHLLIEAAGRLSKQKETICLGRTRAVDLPGHNQHYRAPAQPEARAD